jgi:hypothetical protein
LCLISFFSHSFDARIINKLLIWDSLKHWMLIKMMTVPIMKIFHICNLVKPSIWLYDIRVVSEKTLINDSSSVINFFEMWISKTNKHFVNLWWIKSKIKNILTLSFSK